MKHTPGPWYYDNFGTVTNHPPRKGLKVLLPTLGIIAKVNKQDDGFVVAAAPELLEALEDIVQIYESTDGTATFPKRLHPIAAAKAIIAKAKGESR